MSTGYIYLNEGPMRILHFSGRIDTSDLNSAQMYLIQHSYHLQVAHLAHPEMSLPNSPDSAASRPTRRSTPRDLGFVFVSIQFSKLNDFDLARHARFQRPEGSAGLHVPGRLRPTSCSGVPGGLCSNLARPIRGVTAHPDHQLISTQHRL